MARLFHFCDHSCKQVIDPIERIRLDWVCVRQSPIHGLGLFAQADIPSDAYIGDYDGPTVEEDGRYVLWVEDSDGEWEGVDGRNALRYMNHSLTPNAELRGVELFALRALKRGEEITIHYGEDWEEPQAPAPYLELSTAESLTGVGLGEPLLNGASVPQSDPVGREHESSEHAQGRNRE